MTQNNAAQGAGGVRSVPRVRLATQLTGPAGSEWWVWEYDASRTRMADAPDIRMRHPVQRLVGVYRTRAEAEAHL